MRLPITLALFVLASGCASSPGGLTTRTSTPKTVYSSSNEANFSVRSVAGARGRDFALTAPVDTVWAALPGVFRTLGVEAGVVNGSQRVYGNPNLRVRGRLAGALPSQYVDCGNNPVGAPFAASEALQLSILTGLVSSADGVTRLQVEIQGTANTTTGTRASCESTGKLEEKIHAALLAQISG